MKLDETICRAIMEGKKQLLAGKAVMGERLFGSAIYSFLLPLALEFLMIYGLTLTR